MISLLLVAQLVFMTLMYISTRRKLNKTEKNLEQSMLMIKEKEIEYSFLDDMHKQRIQDHTKMIDAITKNKPLEETAKKFKDRLKKKNRK